MYIIYCVPLGQKIEYSILRLATGWAILDSNLFGGRRFSLLHTRSNLPRAHQASSTIGILSFLEVNSWGLGTDYPPPSSVEQ